jgi:hypothetical protein
MSLLTDNNILWCKTENLADVQNPDTGSGGSVGGTVTYSPAKFNNGSETPAGTTDYIAYTRAGVNIDPNALLFSAWIKTPYSMTNGVPSDATVHRVMDWYSSNSNRVTLQINNRLEFAVVVGGAFIFPTFTTGITWAANTLTYIQVVWDRAGVDGGVDTFRFYINGVKVANSALTIANQATAGGDTHIHNIFFNGNPLNNFEGIIDNYKLYDLPSGQTEQLILDDYNNRNTEGFVSPPVNPENLSATSGLFPDRIEIGWDSVTSAVTYSLHRSLTQTGGFSVISAGQSATTYTDTSASVNTTYWYLAYAENGAGTSTASSVDSGFLRNFAQYNFHSTILKTSSSYNPILKTATVNSKILQTISVNGLIN